MDFKLYEALDRAALAKAFKPAGRMQIRDFLAAETADALYDCLIRDVPWNTVYNEGKETVVVSQAEADALSPAEQTARSQVIFENARSGFQYVYKSYPMLDAYKEGRDPGLILHPFFEFLNFGGVIEFLREISGIDEIIKMDAQATWYGPHQFLTRHNDMPRAEARRLAYVINLTKDWQPDWGGYLQFFDEAGAIVQAFMPRFNTLNLFAVPADHSVGYVSAFAGAPRLAITGWAYDA
ncbi:MAG: 2OG-Fe(II) oxygenase [Sphingomonadales bacterium]|nr:2OG-Fe(II) oxygenase [Sphingomonadales bacterium]